MLQGDIDVAVHSMKDMPDEMPKGLVLGAVLKRENAMDAVVCANNINWEELPKGSRNRNRKLEKKNTNFSIKK